jgi:hypothetical protein
VTSIDNNRRAQALRKLAAALPPPGTNIIVVTHRPLQQKYFASFAPVGESPSRGRTPSSSPVVISILMDSSFDPGEAHTTDIATEFGFLRLFDHLPIASGVNHADQLPRTCRGLGGASH